jgi:hypothetical protein
MAETDSNGVPPALEDLTIQCATLLFELRLALEAALAGVKRIATRKVSVIVQNELQILQNLLNQGAEAMDALDKVLEPYLKRRLAEPPANDTGDEG